MKTYIGIDNGVSGNIGIINPDNTVEYHKMPVFHCLDYTKKKKFLNRIDGHALYNLIYRGSSDVVCFIERPMVNPARWTSSMSAIRALEAVLIVIEMIGKYRYEFVDSKAWQKELLPSGLQKEELKEASLQVGKRLFPTVDFKGFKDADGLLLSEHARRTRGV